MNDGTFVIWGTHIYIYRPRCVSLGTTESKAGRLAHALPEILLEKDPHRSAPALLSVVSTEASFIKSLLQAIGQHLVVSLTCPI